MNNTIQFTLRMQDLMSTTLSRVSSGSQSAFNRMSQSANQMTGRNRVLAMSFTELQNKIRQVEDTISRSTIPSQIASARRELALLQRQSNQHRGNTNNNGVSTGSIASGTILGNLALTGINMIGNGIGSIIQKSMDKETAISGMTTFLGKKGAVNAYKNIQKDAENTPFDTQSLLQVNRSLISAGATAPQARTDSMNLANAVVAVGGSNDTLTRMASNMQQIRTVGKATAMDIRQFGIAGINIYEMLSRSTGKNINEVKEMDVTYEQLAKSLAMAGAKGGIYENALNNAMDTKQGRWSNLKESVTNKLISIGEAFSPVIDGLMNLGTQFVKNGEYIVTFANWLNSGSTSAGVFIVSIATLTAGFVAYQAIVSGVALWTGIVTKAQWLWNLAMTANPIGAIIVGIAALVAGVVVAYNKFEKFRAVVDGVWGVLKEVGSLIKSIITGDLSGIANSMKNLFTGKSFYTAYNQSLAISKTNKINEANKKPKPNNPVFSAVNTGADLANSNNNAGKTAGNTVAGAGPKVVNIHVGKFFDNIQFTTMNGKESAQELENIVMEALARVLYNGSKLV